MAKRTAKPGIATRNIDDIVRMEHDAHGRRPASHRFADRIAGLVGTTSFVVVHLVGLLIWAIFNARLAAEHQVFDPFPFPLLAMLVSFEGVLISTFVLIRQNHMGERADERSHLSLQLALLTEQEVTKVLQILQVVSDRLGVAHHVMDDHARDLGQDTEIHDLARQLRERLPPEP